MAAGNRLGQTLIRAIAWFVGIGATVNQCVFGEAVPSDHLSARTKRIVTRSSGSVTIMTGEFGASAAQLFVMSPGEKNIVWESQCLPWSFKYCSFDII